MYDIDPGYTYYEGTGMNFVFGFYLIYFLVMMAISVGTYVLQSLGIYTIAKRRGIKNPWLSWIPVGSAWIIGCISDQYRYVVKGQIKNKRKALLILQVIMWVAYIAFFAVLFSFIFGTFGAALEYAMDPVYIDDTNISGIMGSVFGALGLYLVMMGIAIAVTVIQYMALYDLYHSCEPKNGTLYLVLSILVSITQPIFLFICRNKDEGMPPRKTEPAYIPQPPVEQQPQWQPAEPVQEPWEKTSEE